MADILNPIIDRLAVRSPRLTTQNYQDVAKKLLLMQRECR